MHLGEPLVENQVVRRMLPRGTRAMLAAVAVCSFASHLCGAEGAKDTVVGRAGSANAALSAALESIRTSDLEKHTATLADDVLEGREAGSRGGRAAAAYLVQQFKEWGLSGGAADGGYFQPFGNGYRNILVQLEGSDPQLREEVIVLGAHYDHVGYGTPRNSFGPIGHIHNGADDNASGTAALLECIEACREAPAPRRTILFAFWDAEEKGLLGSLHWISQPTLSLSRVKFAVNMDMVGRLRNDKVKVIGVRTAAGARQLLSRQNGDEPLALDFDWEMKANSDHHPFFERGIPSMMLHTDLHSDYHRPSDDVEKLNVEGIQRVSRLAFRFSNELANADALPAFRSGSRTEGPVDQERAERPLPPLPGRFGVNWSHQDQGPGVQLTRVAPGSPAERAGLRTGDRILTFAGRQVAAADLGKTVLAAESPAAIVYRRGEDDQERAAEVALEGVPVRLGLNWRFDAAEPGCAILTRVTPGSPAAEAGLKPGDRVYSINEQVFATSDEFRQLATSLPGPLMLEVERSGHVQTVEIMLAEPVPAE